MAIDINIPSQVKNYANLAGFPVTGSLKTIYIAEDTNKTYRWTGSAYVEISASQAAAWGTITGTLSSQTDLNTALNGKQDDITLTTTGTSGASTFVANTLNVPNYSLAGLGGVPTTRTLTINGTTQDLSADRTFTISTGITIGTTAITSGTVGRVLFEGTGNVVSESANLFWDNTNARLDVLGSMKIASATSGMIIRDWTAFNTFRAIYKASETPSNTNYLMAFDTDVLLNSRGSGTDIYYNGSIRARFGNAFALRVIGSGTTTATVGMEVTSSANTNLFQIRDNGAVLINTTTDAGYKLDVNGTARVQGGLSSTANISAGGALVSTGDVACGNKIYNNNFYVENTGATNIGSGQSNAPASAILCASSTTRGFLPPRMTTTQKNAIATPAAGLEVFDSTTLTPSIYNGTNWQNSLVPNSNGNVLINTTTDAGFKLDVNGTARVQNDLTIGSLRYLKAFRWTNDDVTRALQIEGNSNYNVDALNIISWNNALNNNTKNLVNIGLASTVTTQSSVSTDFFNSVIIQTAYNFTYGTHTVKGIYYNPTLTAMVGTTHYAFHSTSGRHRYENLPTSPTGLASGDLWNDAGTLKIV